MCLPGLIGSGTTCASNRRMPRREALLCQSTPSTFAILDLWACRVIVSSTARLYFVILPRATCADYPQSLGDYCREVKGEYGLTCTVSKCNDNYNRCIGMSPKENVQLQCGSLGRDICMADQFCESSEKCNARLKLNAPCNGDLKGMCDSYCECYENKGPKEADRTTRCHERCFLFEHVAN